MTIYATGNALGSTDPRDLLDNAQNFDNAVNDVVNDTWVDRFGVTRKTLKGYDSDFEEDQAARALAFQEFLEGSGWSSLGTYGAGIVITSHTQTVDYLGQPYQLKPSIPASLDAPYVTTGVWATEGVNFKLVGDNSLRQDLANTLDPNNGSGMIGVRQTWAGAAGRTLRARLGDRVSPFDAGAIGDGVADDTAAFSAAVNSGASIIDFCGAKVRITSPVTIPSYVTLLGGGKAELIYEISGNNRALTVGNGFCLLNLKLRPTGNSPNAVYANVKAGFLMEGCEMDFSGFSGVVPGTLADDFSRGIYLADCSDVSIRHNLFKNGWNDHAYNASTAAAGNNMFRTVNVENHGQNGVSVTHNQFDNSWSPIYCSNTNFADLSYNTIRDTADTAIFERCTSGVTRYKSINFNKIFNAGKGAIKILDSNNLTGKGHYAQVVGNIIKNYALYLHTEAVFCQNYFNGTSYVEAPDNLKATFLTVTQNQIFNDAADSNAFGISNCLHVNVSDNIVNIQFAGPRQEAMGQWCKDVVFSGNDVTNINGGIIAYRSDRVMIARNNLKLKGRIEIDSGAGAAGYWTKIVDNTLDNTTPAGSVVNAFGIALPNAGVGVLIGGIEVYGNKFKTTVPYEDTNQLTGKNLMSVVTDANAARCFLDNNILEFSDAVKRQKSNFGDILNPLYYAGSRGTAVYNETTRVLTIKPISDRTATDTITFSD